MAAAEAEDEAEDVTRIVDGAFARQNISREEWKPEHVRKFFTYLHNQGSGLKKTIKEAACNSEPKRAKISLKECRNSAFTRLLCCLTYVVTARWRCFLTRNSGLMLSRPETFFLFLDNAYQNPPSVSHSHDVALRSSI